MDLDGYLSKNGIWHRFVEKPETVHTSDASRASGIELSSITKNLVSRADDGEHILLVVPGDRKVDLQKAALALSKKSISLVPFDRAQEISGYPPGGTPTICHATPMRILMDESLTSRETFFCGGGRRDRLLELRTQEVLRITNAVVSDILVEAR